MRNSDIPLKSVLRDSLNRRTFAYNFANGLLNVDVSEEGFVAALTGPWGSGKTTTINFIVHYLKQICIQKTLEQSVTWYEKEHLDHLHESYLTVMRYESEARPNSSLSLLSFDKKYVMRQISGLFPLEEDIDDIYNYSLYAHKFELGPPFSVIHFSPWHFSSCTETTISIIEELSSAVHSSFGTEQAELLNIYIKEILKLATTNAARNVGVSGIDNFLQAIEKKEKISLSNAKKRLSDSLKKQKNRRIIFVIDDLDRLSPDEASSVISAIKGLANLPNIVYLLSYDQEEFHRIVAKSIRRNRSTHGGDFLEKIVQYARPIPLPTTRQVQQIFQQEILQVLSEHQIAYSTWRLTEAWQYVLQHYIRTPRDANRLTNSFAMAIGALRGRVEPVDLLILTTLETFEPRVYQLLRQYVWS